MLLRNRDARHATAAGARDAFLARASLAGHAPVRRAAWMRLLDARRTHAVSEPV
jgi:hypothetical protein